MLYFLNSIKFQFNLIKMVKEIKESLIEIKKDDKETHDPMAAFQMKLAKLNDQAKKVPVD